MKNIEKYLGTESKLFFPYAVYKLGYGTYEHILEGLFYIETTGVLTDKSIDDISRFIRDNDYGPVFTHANGGNRRRFYFQTEEDMILLKFNFWDEFT